MSGLESVAAIIGITDAAFRSISLLYESFEDLKTAPREVQSLKRELGTLQHCLTQLKHLSTRDEKALSVIKGFGLQEVLELCAQACEPLRAITRNWSTSVVQEWRLRFQFVLNKKEIQRARDNVNSAKQTTILAVVITQLSLKLLEPSSAKEKLQKIEEAKREVAKMTSYAERDRHASHRKASALVDDSRQYSGQGYTESHQYSDPPRSLSTQYASRDNEYSLRSPPPQGRQTHYLEDSSDESTPKDTDRSADGRTYSDSLAPSKCYPPPSDGYGKAPQRQNPPLHHELRSGPMTQQSYHPNSVQNREPQHPQHVEWSSGPHHAPYAQPYAQPQMQDYCDQDARQRESPGTSYRSSDSSYSTNRSQYADFEDYIHRSTAEVKEGISNNLQMREVAGEDNEFANITGAKHITRLRNDVRVDNVKDSAKKNKVGCISGS